MGCKFATSTLLSKLRMRASVQNHQAMQGVPSAPAPLWRRSFPLLKAADKHQIAVLPLQMAAKPVKPSLTSPLQGAPSMYTKEDATSPTPCSWGQR
jgi:hypothetical protein